MHSPKTFIPAVMAAAALAAASQAANPQMGGSMRHVMVAQEGNNIVVHVMSDEPVMLRQYNETYNPPADVLNGTYYSAQYGWMLDGLVTLPPGATALWIRVDDKSPGLSTYERQTFQPIFLTDGSPATWNWDGTMAHNWYAADAYGAYESSYAVYFGDADGNPTPGYGAGQATLRWRACPCDLDENGTDIFDLLTYLDFWFSGNASAEWTGDAMPHIDIFDLLAYLDCWFSGC